MFGRSAADAPEAISKKKKTCLIGVNLTPGVRRKNRKLVRLFSFRVIGEIFFWEPGEFFQNGIGVHKQQVLLLGDGGEHAIDQVAVASAPLSGLLGGGGGWIFEHEMFQRMRHPRYRIRHVLQSPSLPLEIDFRHAQRAQVELCDLLGQKPPERRPHRQAVVAPEPNASKNSLSARMPVRLRVLNF